MTSHPLIKERVQTKQRNQIVDVTGVIEDIVREKKLIDGQVIVFIPHTTAAVTINENADPDVKSDMLKKLSELAPKTEKYYEHGEGNSDSHVKTAMLGNSATILIERGELVLGRWQGVYFCEFDGPREREMFVKVVAFG